MEETLQEKIKSVIAKTGMTYKELANQLGVSSHNFYKWKESSNPRSHKEYEKVVRALDNLLERASSESIVEEYRRNYVTQPKGSMQTIKPLTVCIGLVDEDDSQQYVDENAIPGSVITIKGRPALIAWRNDSPLIGEVDGLIPVNGESMAPRYKSGSLIAIKRLKFITITTAGYDYYIIDKNGKGILRKVKASDENGLTLSAQNEADYPTITRKWEDILAIFSIEAIVTRQST